jgi:hypothetical protein
MTSLVSQFISATPESEANIFGRKGRLVCPQNLHLRSLLAGLEAESRAFGPESTAEKVIGSGRIKWRSSALKMEASGQCLYSS